MRDHLQDFDAGYASEQETADMIRKIYDRTGYVIDTHTAVAAYVCEDYKTRTKDETKCVIASTASPYKFVKSVMQAIGQADGEKDELELLGNLEKSVQSRDAESHLRYSRCGSTAYKRMRCR